jgi:hypothetical protein
MAGRLVFVAVLVGACAAPGPSGAQSAKVGPVVLGARFEYMMRVAEEADPYAWNAATHSASDRSRFMIDGKALDTPYGSFYAKAAAMWTMVGEEDVRKRLRFEQGDYLWSQDLGRWGYSLRLFANERRFFVHDWTAPLVDDDRAGETGENRGVRADISVDDALHLTGVFSMLGEDRHESRRLSYLKALFTHRVASFSASYLTEDPGTSGLRARAAVKAELSSAYKNVFAAVSYRQTGLDDRSWFFPRGSFDWGEYDATHFATVLPPSGAASAEVRVSSLPVTARGDVDLVWRYDAVGEEFVDDLGASATSGVGQELGAYFTAKEVDLNGRVVYRTRVRSTLENEEGRWLDAGIQAGLQNGTECFLRGGAGEVREGSAPDERTNLVHAAVRHRIKRFHTGAHAAWSDMGTDYSARRYAWEGKVALNPAWAFHWRLLLARDYAVSQTACFRIEYRPTDHIFAYIGYGRPGLGDDPFVLEDHDIGLMRGMSSEYTFVVRGDF